VTGDGARRLTRREIIVATGSAARSVPGIDDRSTQHHHERSGHWSDGVPKSIAIMGSGAGGVEFASIFRASAARSR
jgi:dihydrolipoamide dehydrogenase